MGTKVTIVKYCQMRHIKRQSVEDKIKRGVIPSHAVDKTGDMVMIDVDIADQFSLLSGGARNAEQVTRYAGDTVSKDAKITVAKKDGPHDPEAALEKSLQDDEPSKDVLIAESVQSFSKFRNAKISTEELRAKKLELEIAERAGTLISIDDVRKVVNKMVLETKDAILNIPGRVSPIAVSITDPVEMENFLRAELNNALLNLSRINEKY